MKIVAILQDHEVALRDLYSQMSALKNATIKKVTEQLAARGIISGTKIKTGHGVGYFQKVYSDMGINYRIDGIKANGTPHGVKCICDSDPDSWELVR